MFALKQKIHGRVAGATGFSFRKLWFTHTSVIFASALYGSFLLSLLGPAVLWSEEPVLETAPAVSVRAPESPETPAVPNTPEATATRSDAATSLPTAPTTPTTSKPAPNTAKANSPRVGATASPRLSDSPTSTASTVPTVPAPSGESDTSLITETETTEATTNDFYNDPFAEAVEGPSFLSLWLRLMGVLLAFGILAYVILRVVKSRQKVQMQSHPLYKVIASFPLAMNKTIKIIKVVHDYYVVVVAQDTVTLLKRLEDKASIDEVKLHESGEQTITGSIITPLFGDVFKKYSPFEKKAPLDITRGLREKLKKL